MTARDALYRAPPAILALLTLAIALHASPSLQNDKDGGAVVREDRRFFANLFSTRNPQRDDTQQQQTCSCTCGERNVDGRIVGGEPAKTNEFPWIVRLTYFNRFYCGGMLINDRYVLTAAHCIKGFMWFMIKITFGEHDRCDKNAKPETRFVLRAVTGDFSYLNFDNDIAILRLNDKVPITDTIRPICLPNNPDDLYEGAKAIASGWGTLKEDGKPACILQEVEVPVMSNEECRRTGYKKEMISDNMMCAGYKDGKKDSCQGDSGGPLIREKDDKRYELIGIVSWGNGCARPGYPGIYTRVSRYLDWIRSNTADGCSCGDDPEPQPTKKPVVTKKPEIQPAPTSKPTEAAPNEPPTEQTVNNVADEPEKQPAEEPEKQPIEVNSSEAEPEKQTDSGLIELCEDELENQATEGSVRFPEITPQAQSETKPSEASVQQVTETPNLVQLSGEHTNQDVEHLQVGDIYQENLPTEDKNVLPNDFVQLQSPSKQFNLTLEIQNDTNKE